MKNTLLITVLLSSLAAIGHGQGLFVFSNPGAPTRIGSTNGPLADSTLWAQMLVGETADSLTPVGTAVPHVRNGGVFGGIITVPNIEGARSVYAQMLAWNGDLWGTSLAAVPLEQRGETDIVRMSLAFPFDPLASPFFTRGAVVPIPEPSTWLLAMLGTGALVVRFGRRRSHTLASPLLRRRNPFATLPFAYRRRA
jgi:hypothetical protein